MDGDIGLKALKRTDAPVVGQEARVCLMDARNSPTDG
jgi:hypothetical protein